MHSHHFLSRQRIGLLASAAVFARALIFSAAAQSTPPAGAPPPPKAAHPSPLEAEEERATFSLPPGFEIELVAKEEPGVGKFVPLAFDQKGRLWTTTAFEYPVDGNENAAQAKALYENPGKDKVLVFETPFAPGPQKSRVFAEGLAIPLGVLPYKDGCYVQHGPDIVLLHDTDNDGRADKREIILTGFGVQDSHLFPHQFMRAPGGWIWMAQGAFNYGKVRRPEDPPEKAVQFDQTRMAKFRPDGSQFTITSNGPCNIWGLVLNGEGEAFIQEANDFGYPVMPFHEYANYPGCSDRQWKSYAPEFPGTAPDFRMGGTGLSGLALTDKSGPFPEPWRDVMLVANPITNRIQAIKMHRDGPRWRLEKLPDFTVSSDEWFRPVAITVGPDGCLYIVDWYNKVISHNEVPRTHPDRDKTRGRIWRVNATGAKPFEVPDFAKLSGDQLIAKLGSESLAQSHLAWQAIADREMTELRDKLCGVVISTGPVARRVQALWALQSIGGIPQFGFEHLDKDPQPSVRRAITQLRGEIAAKYLETFADFDGYAERLGALRTDGDPTVRIAAVGVLQRCLETATGGVQDSNAAQTIIAALLAFAREPLAQPTAPSTRDGRPIKVREAYESAFERYLVRMFIEGHSNAVAKFLDSDAARELSVEGLLLASLALEPKVSAARVAKLLPQLQRPPEQEEILRLAQFPEELGVGDELGAMLAKPETSATVLKALLEQRTKFDTAKLQPFIGDATTNLLASKEPAEVEMGMKLASTFQFGAAEPALVSVLESGISEKPGYFPATETTIIYYQLTPVAMQALNRLRELGSDKADLFEKLATRGFKAEVRAEAVMALAASKAPDAPQRVLKLYPQAPVEVRRASLDRLSTTKPGAAAIVAAATSGTLQQSALDAALLDRLLAVLGDNDAALNSLVANLGTLLRPVLALDGNEEAWAETGVTLEGAFTVETWVKFDDGITNADGILGAPGQLDINFHDSHFRVWAGPAVNDVAIAKKKTVPGMWTHVAATRNAAGNWRLYIDGELDASGTKPAAQKLENLRLAWTAAPGGTRGALAGFRIWNRERTAAEIRTNFDREIDRATDPALVFASHESEWGKLHAGVKVTKTSDLPPLLTAEQARQLDEKFASYSGLAAKQGDLERGKTTAAVCRACHLMGTEGGQIGPNLSGVGAMGTEAILRNILTPNAAMESAYRIYRVEQRNGTVLDAFFVNEDKDAVVVRLPGTADQRIPKIEIVRTQFLRRSLMPEGLLDALPPEQVSDLFAYLRTLK